jgi:hypothetical protein
MTTPKMTATQAAAYEAMKGAEAIFRAERTAEAQAAYQAANAAYSATLPQRGPARFRDNTLAARAGRRAQAEQAARTAEAMRRFWSKPTPR